VGCCWVGGGGGGGVGCVCVCVCARARAALTLAGPRFVPVLPYGDLTSQLQPQLCNYLDISQCILSPYPNSIHFDEMCNTGAPFLPIERHKFYELPIERLRLGSPTCGPRPHV